MENTKPMPGVESDLLLVITRSFDAPRSRVFDAWLDPAQIAKWIGTRDIRAEAMEFVPKVGGRYRIHMRRTDGSSGPVVSGIYREIVRPERLVFTWSWETAHSQGMAGDETLITLTFRERGGKTEMTLRHEGFAAKESRDSHEKGWNGSFDKLAELLAAA
jgi:uncharacterized protein YndB with AHSA1/START domain